MMAASVAYQSVMNNQIAKHISIARDVLSEAKSPISVDVFQRRLTQAGGSSTFLQQNGPMLLEQLQLMGLAKVTSGMISAASGPVGSFQLLPPPEEVAVILSQLNDELIQLILESDPANTTEACWTVKEPPELAVDGSLSTLSRLKLIVMTDPKGIKDEKGRPCTVAARYQFTPLAGRVKGYFLGILSGLTQQVRK